eukprot:337387-Rhodomonas_salina.1
MVRLGRAAAAGADAAGAVREQHHRPRLPRPGLRPCLSHSPRSTLCFPRSPSAECCDGRVGASERRFECVETRSRMSRCVS